MIDELMTNATGDLIKILVFDGEACNGLIRRLVQGVLRLPAEKQRRLKFFAELRFEDLPDVQYPRLPVRLCKVAKEYIYAMPGPAHSQKNAVGQIMSHIRVIHCGNYFCDAAGCLPHNLPLPAFRREDPMSDRLSALFNSPLYMISDAEARLFFKFWN